MRIPLEKAAELLKSGAIVGLPTETVYGLAASLHHPEAINRIFSIKGRPPNNPLIIHIHDFADVIPYTTALPPLTAELVHTFWPGPLTLVLPILEELIPFEARAGLPTAAFRVPNHPLTRQLLKLTGPLVMPSANKSGRPSSTHPEHIECDFGSEFPILDGGPTAQGVESTILTYYQGEWTLLRLGAIPAEHFVPVLKQTPSCHVFTNGESPLAPGQLYRHYAPQAKLTLLKAIPQNAAGFVLGYSDRTYAPELIALGLSTHPEMVAQNLYSALRQLDRQMIEHAFVDINFPQEGLWLTIAERLTRAADATR